MHADRFATLSRSLDVRSRRRALHGVGLLGLAGLVDRLGLTAAEAADKKKRCKKRKAPACPTCATCPTCPTSPTSPACDRCPERFCCTCEHERFGGRNGCLLLDGTAEEATNACAQFCGDDHNPILTHHDGVTLTGVCIDNHCATAQCPV